MTRAWLVSLLISCGAGAPAVTALPHDGTLVDPAAAPSGSFVAVERYRGHVVVLDFWAGWCAECRAMVPQLARLAGAFAHDGLVVVGVDAGDRAEDAARYATELGITYPIALDPDLAFSDRVAAAELPVVLVIDRTGAIVHRTRHLDETTLTIIRRLVAGH